MSLEETKSLLRTYGIVPNRVLGQNFMIDSSVHDRLCKYSKLNSEDVVLDAGAGFGFLTRYLSNQCRRVIAVEKDPKIARILHERVKDLSNVEVIEGDILNVDIPEFNKVISIPPYYLSTQFVIWLIDRDFDSAVLVVQREFANRVVAKVGSEDYGWLTVVTYQRAEAELFDIVPKWMFYPQPEVDSVILQIKPKEDPPFRVGNKECFRKLTKWLFTERNRKLGNALMPFVRSESGVDKKRSEAIANSFPFKGKRVRELVPENFGAIANVLAD